MFDKLFGNAEKWSSEEEMIRELADFRRKRMGV